MAYMTITNRPSSSRNRTPKMFAIKKGGKAARSETKVQKPVLRKMRNFQSTRMQKESVSIARSRIIGRETAQSTSKD